MIELAIDVPTVSDALSHQTLSSTKIDLHEGSAGAGCGRREGAGLAVMDLAGDRDRP